jgi:molecular chaperone DnaK
MDRLALITPPETMPTAPTEPLRVLGIDLGTTNSTVAEIRWEPGDPDAPRARCLEVEQPTRQGTFIGELVPSVVVLHDGSVLVGEGAKDLRTRVNEHDLELYRNIFWGCKNDIGVRRTYHKAPTGFRSAREIAGHVLRFLVDAAIRDDPTPLRQTVVTAPASFQAAQRQDTVEAAGLAGLDLSGGGALLDEPIAAFLDFIISGGAASVGKLAEPATLAVFDFGGGTCDVAVFRLQRPHGGELLDVAPLTVSRYHRLGGGDIDSSIAVDVLIPQLLHQNGLSAHTLDYEAKAKYVIPALLGLAESLKIGLCREITRLKRFGRYDDQVRQQLVKKNPGAYRCGLADGTELLLQSPTLSATQLDSILEPFLDTDLLYARETDYGLTCSIFAPLGDALDRAGLRAEDIDLCLMVGGSSLIPQVPEALCEYLPSARLLQFDDPELTQTAIARGAAWQALSLALYGRSIVQPVAGDSIHLVTQSGPLELIAAGAKLPYPRAEGWAEYRCLVVPETNVGEPVRLRLELRDSSDGLLASPIWQIAHLVNKGDGLLLRYRMDANQVLHLELALDAEPDVVFNATIENPLSNVVNPNAKRDRILALEEQMRTKAIPKAKQRETVEEIALLYADLGQRERALNLLGNLLKPTPDGYILNRMGIICGQLGDVKRQEKLYRQSAQVWNSTLPLFNLALSFKNQGRVDEAMSTIEAAIAQYAEPPYHVLQALLHDKLSQPAPRDDALRCAFAAFDPLPTLTDWQLGWFRTAADLAKDAERRSAADAEQRRRGAGSEPTTNDSALPGIKTDLTRT